MWITSLSLGVSILVFIKVVTTFVGKCISKRRGASGGKSFVVFIIESFTVFVASGISELLSE